MTREEADKLLQNCSLDVDGYYWTDVEDILMKLSDDFESRTCESCVYNTTYTKCNKFIERPYTGNTTNDYKEMVTFCCNKWESKDAK